MAIVSYEFEYDLLSGQSSFSPVKSTRITSLYMTQKRFCSYTRQIIYIFGQKIKIILTYVENVKEFINRD